MKVELNWIEGPPTKIGKCLLAIRGSEDAIPGVLGESGVIWSWTNPAVKYNPDTIAYHAAWPIFPRERDERWIECDRRTYEDQNKGFSGKMTQVFADGDSAIYEKQICDRLVKEASPSWQGVDPQRFMDEVRGRVPFEEALRLLRDLTDLQNGPPLETYREQWENTMVEIQDFLNAHEV